MKKSCAILILALCYALAVHFTYVEFTAVVYEYVGYRYRQFETFDLMVLYVLVLVPLCFYQASNRPTNLGVALVYCVAFSPGLLVYAFMSELETLEVLWHAFLLSTGMTMLVIADRLGPAHVSTDMIEVNRARSLLHPAIQVAIFVFSAVAALLVLAYNYSHMQLVGFRDVYELRYASRDVNAPGIVGYASVWLTFFSMPYFVASALSRQKPLHFLIAILIALLIYAAMGSKIAAVLPFALLGLDFVLRKGRDPLLWLLLGLTPILLFAVTLANEDYIVVKSLVFDRTVGISGWTLHFYEDYFAKYGYTYYTHIRAVDALFGGYPYGDLILGQLIAVEYVGNDQANFNANFWASDGFAALGPIGILVASFATALFFVLVNRASRGVSPRMTRLWFVGTWAALLNSPLSVAALSGGGLLIIAFLYLHRSAEANGVRFSSGSAQTNAVSLKDDLLGGDNSSLSMTSAPK